MSADPPIAADTALVVILDKTSKYVLLTREKNGSVWWPGGKLEPNETPVNAAIRELEEETGLKLIPSDLVLVSSKQRTATHGAHHNFMIRPDAKLDLHFMKFGIVSRAMAGYLVSAAETAHGDGNVLLNTPKIMSKPFSDPSLLVDYDPDPNKAPSERISYGVFANWELFNKVVTPDHIGQLVIDDLGIGTPVNVRFTRDSNFHHLAKKIDARVAESKAELLGSTMTDNMSSLSLSQSPQIAFSPLVSKSMPKFTMFSEFTDEQALIKWLETTKQQLQGCNVNLVTSEAVSHTCNLITDTNIADWIRDEKRMSADVFPWFSFDEFEQSLLENFVARNLGDHYRGQLDDLKQVTDDSMGFMEYKRNFTRITGLMNKFGSPGDRTPPNILKTDFIAGLTRVKFRDHMNIWVAENPNSTLFSMLEKATTINRGIYPQNTGLKRRADEMPSAPRNPPATFDNQNNGTQNRGRSNGNRGGRGGRNGSRGFGGRNNGGRGRGRFGNHRRENNNSGKNPGPSNNQGYLGNNPWKRHELSDEYIADAAQKANRTVGLQHHFENIKLNLAPGKLDQYMKEGRCFKCGDKHLFDDCPKLRHNKPKNNTQ